ncbi:unnamed protein product [Orchesella dallaii]|uniref:BTB domain-containing protein n=1 Tax=Orchesella dallaii TaxID=48710 RepID=A0ABP1RKE8_9HEXA
MRFILSKNLVGDLSFINQKNEDDSVVATLNCPVDPQFASGSDEDSTTWKGGQTTLSNGNGGDNEKLSFFEVRMVLRDLSQETQRLEGYVYGELFGVLFQAFKEEQMRLKLQIGLVCSSGWRKKMVLQEMEYLNEEPETNLSFRFIEMLDPCWIPTPGFQYKFELTAELTSKPRPVQTPPPAQQMPLSLTMMNRRFLEEGIQADFALVTGKGDSIPCHRIFLKSASQAFLRMIELDGTKDPPENLIRLPNPSTREGIGALLKYIYFRDVQDPKERPEIACELLVISHCYQVPDLENCMKDLLFEQPDEWWQRDRKGDVAEQLLPQIYRWGEQYEGLVGRILEILKL